MTTHIDTPTDQTHVLKRVFDRVASHVFAFAVFAPIRAAVAVLSALSVVIEAVVAMQRKRHS